MATIFPENYESGTSITGTAEDEVIINYASDVTITANGGNDSVTNSTSESPVPIFNVRIDAGDGNDYVNNYISHNGSINAGTGNDTVVNHSRSNANVTILGGDGEDLISNDASKVTVDGGAGNDSIINSHYSYENGLSNMSDMAVSVTAGDGNDMVVNSGGFLTIDGAAGDDDILNSGENVSIIGGDGNDKIDNATGTNVTINGDVGNDTISNTGTNVLISGDDGDDIICLSWEATSSGGESLESWVSKNSTLIGGAGNDSIEIIRYSEDGSLPENNVIQYTEGDGHDTVWGYSASNSLRINSSVGWSSVVSGNNIVVTVGDGSITLVDAATSTSGVNINGVNYPIDNGGGGTESIPPVTLPPDTPVTPVNPAAPTDVVFIIDNTSSMREEIDNVKTAIISFAKNLANSGAGYRLGLVEFGDLVDSQIKVYGFTDRDTFISWVDGITLTDGGDGPESGLEAITAATTMDFMPGSNKRFIVVSDADFHNLGESGNGDPSTYFQTEAVQALLNANAVKMDVVGTPESNCQTEWEPLANATGGKFYDINKLAGGEVLEEIADDILGRAHVNINLDIDSVPEGTTSGVFVVTPVLNAAGAVVPASSNATFKTAAEEGDYVVGYVIANKAYMADPNSPWRQIVTIPDNWIVSGTYQDDALNVTGSNAVISGSLGKDNISINEDAVNTTLVDVSELQNGSDTLSFSKRVTPGTLQQNFTGGGTALYTTDSDGELDFVINLQGIAALDESLLNCEVSNAGKPNTIRELIYGEVSQPIFNDTLEGRIMFAQWGYGFTPPEGNPLFVDPTLATSADLAADFGSPTLDDITPANFAVTQDDFTAQDFNAEFSVKQAYKLSAASKANFC